MINICVIYHFPSKILKTIAEIYCTLVGSFVFLNHLFVILSGRYNLPPYWSLGFHLCRYGYDNLGNMIAAVDRTTQYDIPQDAQWGDIDIMERQLDFTISTDR